MKKSTTLLLLGGFGTGAYLAYKTLKKQSPTPEELIKSGGNYLGGASNRGGAGPEEKRKERRFAAKFLKPEGQD